MTILRSILLALAVLPASAHAGGLAEQCAQIRNDDTARPYDPSLRTGITAAFERQFPKAPQPDEQLLRAQTHIRCMDGRLLACFTGANLPCGKINAARGRTKARTHSAEKTRMRTVSRLMLPATTPRFSYRCTCRPGRGDGQDVSAGCAGLCCAVMEPHRLGATSPSSVSPTLPVRSASDSGRCPVHTSAPSACPPRAAGVRPAD